jgi:hypothetical protein
LVERESVAILDCIVLLAIPGIQAPDTTTPCWPVWSLDDHLYELSIVTEFAISCRIRIRKFKHNFVQIRLAQFDNDEAAPNSSKFGGVAHALQ